MYKGLLIVYFFFTMALVFGQEQEINHKSLKFKHISVNEGLSQSSVLCILQDKKGFMWFGTRDGLNKYDGDSFKTYRYSAQDSTSLSHNYIVTLFEDDLGNLWISTKNGLDRYIPETESFERIKSLDSLFYASNNRILGIIEDNKTHLWLATNQGLINLNTENEDIEQYIHRRGDVNGVSSSALGAILKTNDGRVWIKTSMNVELFDPETGVFKHYAYPEEDTMKINKNYNPVLYEDFKGTLWMGYRNGLAFFNKKEDAFQFFKTAPQSGLAITSEVRSICEDYNGMLWVGTYDGLYIINKTKNKIFHYTHDENNLNSLSQNSIFEICQDIKGDMWIGTYAGGINYYDRNCNLFRHFTSGTNNTKLNYKVVSSIIETPDDKLWIGTEGGGINVYDKNKGAFKYYTHNSDDPNSLSVNNVKAMIRDHDGIFWIGTHNGGLNVLNPKKRPFIFKKYSNIPGDTTSLSDNRILSLLEDYNKNIWIGTSGGGLNVFDRKSQSIIRVADTTFIGKYVNTIVEIPDKDHILLGSNRGVAKLNLETKKLTPIPFVGKEHDFHRMGAAVSIIYQDHNNNLWIGTDGDGLFCHNLITGNTKKYDHLQGLPSDVIYGILPDDNNNIWISTNYGLSRLNLQSRQIKNFNESDGLQGNEFNYGAYLKDRIGNLIFGGSNGLNIFNPNTITENTFTPLVCITSFKVNNKPYLNITDSISEITLKHFQNVFNINFVALSYSQSDKNQYAYKLEGFDSDWNYIGNKKSATYTNLDAGTYRFKVKASNNDGIWNEIGASLKIRIHPAPWRTGWAYLIYTLLLTSIFLVIRRYSLIRIRERNELKHQRLERERIQEVNKMKLQFFTNISHEIRTYLTLILGSTEKISHVSLEQKANIDILKSNVQNLLSLVKELMDFRKAETQNLKLQVSRVNLIPYLHLLCDAFQNEFLKKDITPVFLSKEELNVWIDPKQMKKVFTNLLSNAVKFSNKGGIVQIMVLNHKDNIEIKIINNGKAIEPDQMKNLFQRYYQGEYSKQHDIGYGIGLALSKSIVELHGGILKVESHKAIRKRHQENRTCFSVFLLKGKDHLKTHCIIENSGLISPKLSNKITEDITPSYKTSSDSKPINILLVEDNKYLRHFICNSLKTSYNITKAKNGGKGLKSAIKNIPDIIITDIMMPKMNGYDLVCKLKENIQTNHIPIIFLTALDSNDQQIEGFQSGVDTYLTKPFSMSVLDSQIKSLLRNRELLREKYKTTINISTVHQEQTNALLNEKDKQFLKEITSIIEKELGNQDFSVIDLAKSLHISAPILYKKLNALTGMSVNNFIKSIRLHKSYELLKLKELKIFEIAYSVGYKDEKYFSREFKKHFNKTPSEIRNLFSCKL
ncbi:two-component regulator propeller domain-containing protein [uncultured Sunxiuqinia sp.]|uniref:hybrid sensor histidine kinase/response regulator transcription factor n=1 Tax=uncultured Sunxiuqinia sp. TaxID=1573825 RepID=UPI00261A33C6|nr:two-component regulator propeller domain-containing protein [uncultured Sunxiuqinia sp.]